VSVADVPVGALVATGKVIALSGPAFATGGILLHLLPSQLVPATQEAVIVAMANGLPPLL